MSHLPKKSLGQNFLTSIPARIAIVKAGEIEPGDTILEIGPGKGFLTEGLLEKKVDVVALEKDKDLLPYLASKFEEEISAKQLTLIEGDVLEFNPSSHNALTQKYKIVANIPYYITGAILSHFLAHTFQPKTMVVLVQKEVADRICAKNGKESLLSLSVKAYGDPLMYYKVSKGSFFPIPKVDSGVLQIKNISRSKFNNQYHEAIFFKLIRTAFAHKRKFVISNIEKEFSRKKIEGFFQSNNLSEKSRAEDITLTMWLNLASFLSKE